VILPDANLPLYAYDTSSVHHEAARHWFEMVLGGPELVGFAWATMVAFLRITTHPRIFARPLAIAEATAIVQEWLTLPSTVVIEPTDRHLQLFGRLAVDGQARGALVPDAHLATLSVEHGATVYSADRDFTRFPGVRVVNPLNV
jgi:uncharacterized protein